MSTSPRPAPVPLAKHFPAGYQAMLGLEQAVRESSLGAVIFELIKLRASQINGCAYCIDMHHKDARAGGETEDRLYMLTRGARPPCTPTPSAPRSRSPRRSR